MLRTAVYDQRGRLRRVLTHAAEDEFRRDW